MKKFLILALATIAFPFVALAQSTTSTITLGSDFNDGVWSNVQNIIVGLAPQIELILGVILAAVVIGIIIDAIRK